MVTTGFSVRTLLGASWVEEFSINELDGWLDGKKWFYC